MRSRIGVSAFGRGSRQAVTENKRLVNTATFTPIKVIFAMSYFWQNSLLDSGHIAHKFRRPTILQLNIKGLTASKMNVLYYLALQSEALVILLQKTHCTDAEKLILPNYQLAGSSLSRKHGLATFVHKRQRYMLLDQSPPTSEI